MSSARRPPRAAARAERRVDSDPVVGDEDAVAVSYDAFAPYFDAWQRSFGCAYADLILPRVRAVLARHAPGARRVVDLGVGTGDLAIALARSGLDVVGVDRAPAMLEVARRKALAAGVAVTLVEDDLRDVRLAVPADVALSVYTVVNQLTEEGDLDRTLRAVRACLVPGGHFVFELNLPEAYARYWHDEETVDLGDAVVVRTHRARVGTGVIEADVSIRRRTCGGWDEVWDHVAQRPWGDGEVEAALVRAGLGLVARERYDPFEANAGPTKALWTCRRGS